MVKLTPIGSEIESIIAAVIVFLVGGLLSFLCCFFVTHVYLCYKRRMTRRKRRHERRAEKLCLSGGEDALTYVILDEDAEFSSSDEGESPNQVKILGTRHSKPSHRNDKKEHGLSKEQIERINHKN